MARTTLRKKGLVFNFLDFIKNEADAPDTGDEKRASLKVAIRQLEKAFELKKDDRKMVAHVDLLSKLQKTHESHERAEQYKRTGHIAMIDRKYADAVSAYTQAIEIFPLNAYNFYKRAIAQSRLGCHLAVIRDCRQAIMLDPTYGKAYGRLGRAYSKINDWEESVKAYQNAVRFNPGNENHKRNLQLVLKKLFETMEWAVPPHYMPVDMPVDVKQFTNEKVAPKLNSPEVRHVGTSFANLMEHRSTQFVDVLPSTDESDVSGSNSTIITTTTSR